jgi:hypothetical protein
MEVGSRVAAFNPLKLGDVCSVQIVVKKHAQVRDTISASRLATRA